jgi:hypothetical protein
MTCARRWIVGGALALWRRQVIDERATAELEAAVRAQGSLIAEAQGLLIDYLRRTASAAPL